MILFITLTSACAVPNTQEHNNQGELEAQQHNRDTQMLNNNNNEETNLNNTKNNTGFNESGKLERQESDEQIDWNESYFSKLRMELGKEYSANQEKHGVKIQSASQLTIVVDGVTLTLNPRPFIENGSTMIPIRAISTHFGAGVWWNGESRTVGLNKGDTSISFIVGQTVARVNQNQVSIPPSKIINNSTYVPVRFISETFGYKVSWNGSTRTVMIDTTSDTYKVVSGDTLSGIATKYNTTVAKLRSLNQLTSDVIRVGQTLIVSGTGSGTGTTSNPAPTNEGNAPQSNEGATKTFTTHTIQSGDNAWNLSIKYGIPMLELLKVNNLSMNSTLSIGQRLKIPVYDIPVKTATSSRHGELLDWWTEARYVFPIGKEATITDFQSGRTFKIRHTMGGNHADSEPLTSSDAEVMRQIWGGSFSWTPRAVIISVDGRRLAAAMHSFPHEDQDIKNNNYPGHFCIHFLNSTRHNDGLVQASMQTQVRISAGVK
jgi:LysM repeat protein